MARLGSLLIPDSAIPRAGTRRPGPGALEPARRARHSALFACLSCAALLVLVSGCTFFPYLGSDRRGRELGLTYFVGGAGGVGSIVGTLDVPAGLRRGGYTGGIEVFAWQAIVGGTVRDVIDRNRNEGEGRRLAGIIQEYLEKNPGRPVNIIALSAGTGITIWALEALPRHCRVGTVVFLGSALSRDYDLSLAMQRVDGRLYCFFSHDDSVLRFGLPLTGSVDREDTNAPAAGLGGFVVPPHASASARALYARKLQNRAYQAEYAQYGYHGGHTDSTSADFIAHIVTPLLECPRAESSGPTSAPATGVRAQRPAPPAGAATKPAAASKPGRS